MVINDSAQAITKMADAAFRQAAAKIIEEARRFGTSIIVYADGQIVERTWQETEQALAGKTNRADDD